MSLRVRLALLYSTIFGGMLLIFGVGVFVLVNIFMINQVDEALENTVREILANAQVSAVGEMDMVELPTLEFKSNVYVQYWDRRGKLNASSPGISQFRQPLDPDNNLVVGPVYRDLTIQDVHLRVLSIPIQVGGRPAGVLQVATTLALVDTMRQSLISILFGGTIITMLIAGLISWWSVGQALAPLETVTDTALQITRADDLSRRIPYQGPADDEIGLLIRTFNRTLERLEVLFTSQQRFLADVSHELRTPLTVIKGNVDLMKRMKVIDEESLNSINDEANRLTRLVGDLLMLAQAESGKLALNLQPVELDALVLEVFQEMHVLAQGKVTLKLPEIDQVLVSGDRDRIKQVLINLVANAIQYTPAGGEVSVMLSKNDEQAKFVVCDTGPGIPANDLPYIFDRFYRAEKSRTRSKGTGFGLGLSIAYWIIDRHGGRIDVESHDGKGTTFCIWLPLYDSETETENNISI